MGHNSVVSGHPKSTGILRVDRFSTGPLGLRRHSQCASTLKRFCYCKNITLLIYCHNITLMVDESITHPFSSPFFIHIRELKFYFNNELWNLH